MHEHVTLLRPDARPDSGRISDALPADLLDQIRKRVRILALLLLVAFASDLVIAAVVALRSWLTAGQIPPEALAEARFLWGNVAGVAASIGLWWAAHSRQVSTSRLLTIGLAYEVGICAVIAMANMWGHYRTTGFLPQLTWVPVVVILFPLILPGPPRRILVGAILAASMAPLAILVLQSLGKVTAGAEDYFNTTMASAFAVVFAVVGARVVYGLGRQVAAARELGSYQLEEMLGQGGMGEVWRARHRMLARPAAVKLIRHTPNDASGRNPPTDAIHRFEREAQAIAGLRSPHTVELFDFGVADNGAFYYAMELLDGLDTHALVSRFGPVSAERSLHLLRQTCHSLSEAHARGLVHRDIKPANIFVCCYGEDWDFVKVLDFGIVKESQRPSGEPAQTLENAFHGTPAFAAPEQAEGKADLDGRADIYAVGCLAFWLLTGQHVFSADTPMGLLMAHVNTNPTPPSACTELPIPTALDNIVLSCLAKDPAERPQSARELVILLNAVPGATAWTQERAQTWWTTHLPGEAEVGGL
jgi:hypothetical protein